MPLTNPVYIASACRTPMGSYLGALSSLTAPALGTVAIKAAIERAGIEADAVGEVFMGNVLSAGVGQAPARQAAIGADVPTKTPATTVSATWRECATRVQSSSSVRSEKRIA